MAEESDVARLLGVSENDVRIELGRAVRRSEPDALEVYGLIKGKRFVARRADALSPWVVSLERRSQPWERRSTQ